MLWRKTLPVKSERSQKEGLDFRLKRKKARGGGGGGAQANGSCLQITILFQFVIQAVQKDADGCKK